MYISKGNKKMSFATWSLPAQVTCPNRTELCSKSCYAMKAQRMYSSVRSSRQLNFEDSKSESFVHDMVAAIAKNPAVKKFGVLRIHESGDFYNQTYLNKWILICKALPSVMFLAFTKSLLDYSDCPDNMQIVYSVWQDSDVKEYQNLKISYAGDCVPDNKKVFECIGHCDNCGVCWKLYKCDVDGVHFDIH